MRSDHISWRSEREFAVSAPLPRSTWPASPPMKGNERLNPQVLQLSCSPVVSLLIWAPLTDVGGNTAAFSTKADENTNFRNFKLGIFVFCTSWRSSPAICCTLICSAVCVSWLSVPVAPQCLGPAAFPRDVSCLSDVSYACLFGTHVWKLNCEL